MKGVGVAGDWIKMRSNLWDDPRVARLCDMTDQGEAAVIGGLYWLWATADQHTEDGVLDGLTLRQIDRKTGVQGLGAALVAVGWLSTDGDSVLIPNFEDHNGSSAKKRLQTARRVAAHKASGNAADVVVGAVGSDAVTPDCEEGNAVSVSETLAVRDLEKRREEKREEGGKPPVGSEQPTKPAAGMPACPADQLVALYHEVLPELPRCRLMTDSRRKALQRRWRWVLASRLADGNRRAQTAADALDWFRRFFERARGSDFLMGRGTRSAGHEGWQCDLDFLVGDKGLKAVVEKTEVAA
jgi:hypothetical protein